MEQNILTRGRDMSSMLRVWVTVALDLQHLIFSVCFADAVNGYIF